MNSDGQLEPHTKIVRTLLSLCQQGQTGTLFLSTDQNHMATVTLDQGSIVAMQYRSKRGERAVDAFNAIETASYKFDDSIKMLNAQSDLPSTSIILQQLGAPITSISQPTVAPDGTITPETAEPEFVSLLTDTEKQIIQTTMAKYVGPLASVVCQNVFNKTEGLEQTLNTLSSQMPDQSQAQQFLDEVRKNLAG